MRAIETRRWTREEYERMATTGIFGPEERLELIDGEILTVTPQGSAHATAVHLAAKALAAAFGGGFYIRIHAPLALDDASEPEPDVAVVSGSERDYSAAHPTSALLVVEVSDATLQHDRKRKGSLYARAGIPEYWIVNVIERRLEVFRNPVMSSEAPLGWRYGWQAEFQAEDSVRPLRASATEIAVSDLIP